MSTESSNFLSRPHLPQACRPITATSDQPLSVAGQGYGIDLAAVPLKGADLPSCGHLPQAGNLVTATSGQPQTVIGQRHRQRAERHGMSKFATSIGSRLTVVGVTACPVFSPAEAA